MAKNLSKTYHSLTFTKGRDTVNTWDNWSLIPSSRPVVAAPTPAYKYVEIPGKDGSLDLTDYLVKGPTYSNRQGSFEFYVTNLISKHGYSVWISRKEEIASFLDGSKMKMMLDDDPEYYYIGRFFLKEWRNEASFSKVIIDYTIEPFKYKRDGRKAGL